jgi:hypothetical protein
VIVRRRDERDPLISTFQGAGPAEVDWRSGSRDRAGSADARPSLSKNYDSGQRRRDEMLEKEGATASTVHDEPTLEKVHNLQNLKTLDLPFTSGALRSSVQSGAGAGQGATTEPLVDKVVLRRKPGPNTPPRYGHFGLNLRRHVSLGIRRADLVVPAP